MTRPNIWIQPYASNSDIYLPPYDKYTFRLCAMHDIPHHPKRFDTMP